MAVIKMRLGSPVHIDLCRKIVRLVQHQSTVSVRVKFAIMV